MKDIESYVELANDLKKCVSNIWKYALANIDQGTMDGNSISISVPTSVDPLLEMRYAEHYSEHLRFQLWELIYAVLKDTYERENYRNRINHALEGAFGMTAKGSALEIDDCEIYDCDSLIDFQTDPVTVADGSGATKVIDDFTTLSNESSPSLTIEISFKT